MSGLAAALLADSPALLWDLQGNANDTSGNARNGTNTGGTFGGAAIPPGEPASQSYTPGRITSSYNPFAAATSRSFVWACVRTSSSDSDTIFGGDGTTAPLMRANPSANTIDFYSQPGYNVSWTIPAVGSAWLGHLLFNQGADTAALYVNGSLVSSQTLATDFSASSGNFTAGVWSNSFYDTWSGRLAYMAVYTSILSGASIANHYSAYASSGIGGLLLRGVGP